MALGVPNLAGDITNSMMGTVSEVAQLIITDYRALRDAKALTNQQNAMNNNNVANGGAMAGLNQPMVGVPVPVPVKPDTRSLADQSTAGGHAVRKLVFEVQFNPSELSINASELTINKQTIAVNEEAVANSINTNVSTATINMNVNFTFDKMNETDAFQMESGTLGIAGLGTAGGVAAALAAGKTFSVKPEVEALMAALRDGFTREAEFRWNDFSFAGMLQYIQVRYTMFSPAGHPIRATVAMRMKREGMIGDEWENDFNTTFGGDGGQALSRTQQNRVLNM